MADWLLQLLLLTLASHPLLLSSHIHTLTLSLSSCLTMRSATRQGSLSLQQKSGATTSTHPITHSASQPHPLLTLSPYCETISLLLFDDEICRGGIVLSLNSTLSNYTFFRFPPCLARNCLTMSSAPWQGLLKPAVVP